MNVARSFAQYLEDSGVATFGQDLFISRAPTSNDRDTSGSTVPQNIWWLVANGGSPDSRLLRNYSLNVYYRDRSADAVYEKLQKLEEDITCEGCLTLEGYEVVEVVSSGFFADQDIDSEDRTVGLLQVNIKVYKECQNGIS
jgi:hypothetical protein